MSIDDSFLRDPRVRALGRLMGWDADSPLPYATRGRLLDVFAVCYDRAASTLEAGQIDDAAHAPGMAAAMVRVGLAHGTAKGLRVSGASGRIDYLKGQSDSGRRGGIKSGETRRMKSQASDKPLKASRRQPQGSPNPPDPVPDPAPDIPAVPERRIADGGPSATVPLALVPPSPPAGADHRAVVDAFDRAYRGQTGSAPTWGPKQGAMVRSLLAKHPAGEVVRRIGVLFDGPPSWLRPPHDLGTLVQHFDKLAASPAREVRVGRAAPASQGEFQDGEVEF